MIENMIIDKHGKNWKINKPSRKDISAYDMVRSSFFSPKPKHSIKLDDYKEELYDCV